VPPSVRQQKKPPSLSSNPENSGTLVALRVAAQACHFFCVPPSVVTAVLGIFSSPLASGQLKIPSLPMFLLTCGSLRAAVLSSF